jgi:hypothetical protein
MKPTYFTVPLFALALGANALAQNIFVTPSGVGVNTASPGAKWEVSAGSLGTTAGDQINAAYFTVSSANTDRIQLKAVRANNGIYWDTAAYILQRRVDVTDMGFVKFGDRDVTLGSGSTDVLRVRQNGNVTVGAPLNTSSRMTVHQGPASPDAAIRVSSDLGWISFIPRSVQGGYSTMVSENDQALIFTQGNAVETGSLVIGPWSTGPKGIKIIGSTGNVGIGTPNATHRLTVNGQVKSKGFVTDTSNWADHVFADDYQLPSLTEVENHIKEKRHLPGVPSEKEVVENGLDLGAMSAAQMAQIEQIMLHVIALNKKVEAQQSLLETQALLLDEQTRTIQDLKTQISPRNEK